MAVRGLNSCLMLAKYNKVPCFKRKMDFLGEMLSMWHFQKKLFTNYQDIHHKYLYWLCLWLGHYFILGIGHCLIIYFFSFFINPPLHTLLPPSFPADSHAQRVLLHSHHPWFLFLGLDSRYEREYAIFVFFSLAYFIHHDALQFCPCCYTWQAFLPF